MRVVVFGASGVQGKAQVYALAKAGHHPVAVSRTPQPLTHNSQSLETFAADFSDSSAITESLKNADAIFLNLPSTSFQPLEPMLAATRTIGQAAKSQSVNLIIFNTSMPVPEKSAGIEAQDHRRQMREILRDMGLDVISIQPVVFIDNLLEGWAWPPIRDTNTIIYCHKPTLDVSWICHDDIAACMIAALKKPELSGRNIPIGGPETVRLPVLAQKLSKGWGRDMKYVHQTVDDFCVKIGKAMEERANIDASVLMEQMFRAYSWYNDAPEEPFKVDMKPICEELGLDINQLTSIEDWGQTHNPFASQ